ncbi:MAG TPA: hypothetical protein VF944_04580 [Candidatus Bathyarchaeia archaeon]
MSYRLVRLEFLDSFFVGFYVFGVDFVLGRGWVEGAQFEEDFDGSLVFCGGEAFGAFSL